MTRVAPHDARVVDVPCILRRPAPNGQRPISLLAQRSILFLASTNEPRATKICKNGKQQEVQHTKTTGKRSSHPRTVEVQRLKLGPVYHVSHVSAARLCRGSGRQNLCGGQNPHSCFQRVLTCCRPTMRVSPEYPGTVPRARVVRNLEGIGRDMRAACRPLPYHFSGRFFAGTSAGRKVR